MTTLTRADMIRIAIDEYFETVSASTIDTTLGFFCEDAVFQLYPSGRRFVGHSEIADMYHEVFARHGVIERQVVDICCDEEAGLLSATFRGDNQGAGDGPRIMHNINFWKFRGDKFAWVKVFTSDPNL